jgi:hypothetical protein
MEMTTSEKTEERIHFLLNDSADRLKTEELARIIEATRHAGAVIHVNISSYQVVIGVLEQNGRRVEETLESMGYLYTSYSGKINDHSTFRLEGATHEALF